jgi:uncharacterized protein YgiM (DUF1202 family)
MKKFVYIFILGLAIGIIIIQLISFARIVKLESQDVLFKITIITDYINVRNQPTTQADKAYEVIRGEKYDVIEIFDEDPNYIWYKIIYSDRRTGWIASAVEDAWVEEVK